MLITILTLFPEMFVGPFDHSIVKRAKENNHVTIRIVNIRDYGLGKHNVVDDTVYGGGIGMVLRVDVIDRAIRENRVANTTERVVLMSASGIPFTQKKAKDFSTVDHLMLICGHYEGIDERILEFIDEEISVGDFVLTGGEIPTMAIVDAVVRLLPGVLKPGATEAESFSLRHPNGTDVLVEHPQYTRPLDYKGHRVPEILVQGDHAKIAAWRAEASQKKTEKNRADLKKRD